MDTHIALLIGHVLAAILGTGGATFIEVNLYQALKDGKMDESDRAFMGKSVFITRIGMVLGVLTGLGFVIEYWMKDQLFRLDGVFWAKMLIFIIIVINAWLLAKHKVGLYWGSAFSFVSWWAVFLLGMFLTNGIKFFPANVLLSFFSIIVVYLVFVSMGAPILHKIRQRGKLPPPQVPTEATPTSTYKDSIVSK